MLHLTSWTQTLPMMASGMLGIILVMGVIVLVIMLLNKLTSRKKITYEYQNSRVKKSPGCFHAKYALRLSSFPVILSKGATMNGRRLVPRQRVVTL